MSDRTRARNEKGREKPGRDGAATGPSTAPEAVRPEPGAGNGTVMRALRLPGKGSFVFCEPCEGLSVADARRIACHLLTLAEDFDPAKPMHAEMFSVARRPEVVDAE